MKAILQLLRVTFLSLVLAGSSALAQTDGTAKMEVTLLDYVGTSNDDHYTVVWVTTADNTFIKSLRKQGPSSWTSSEWANHCRTWNTARNGSTVLDGYTSATARDYTGTNSPVLLSWNGRDAANTLMPDGDYKFWVQYAENSGQGPYTTSGLLWTKGPTGATNTYPNQSVNFANMKVTWTPAGVPTVAPTITSAPPTAAGTVGTAYSFAVTATGTPAPTFTASGLPTGLSINPTSGVISGTPTADGTFTGTITAANGTLPNATQAFSIVISAAPVAPAITSAPPTAAGTVGTAYSFAVTATGTPAPTFTASGLPTGLSINPTSGVISGTPTADGTFTGTITAANGTLPNATQAFSIVISPTAVAPTITSIQLTGNNLTVSGSGPANSTYHVLVSADPSVPIGQWTSVATNATDSTGAFTASAPVEAGVASRFMLIRMAP